MTVPRTKNHRYGKKSEIYFGEHRLTDGQTGGDAAAAHQRAKAADPAEQRHPALHPAGRKNLLLARGHRGRATKQLRDVSPAGMGKGGAP